MCEVDIASGSVFPFSQFRTVNDVTPNFSPTCFWERPNSKRLFLICSPRVLGSKSKGFFLNDLRHTRTNGRKATRPCFCGFHGHYNGKCRCTPDQIARYRNKISGPLLDRIDIQIEVPAVPQDDLLNKADGEALLRQALTRLDLSARAYHRVLKVARTIADLAGSKSILTPHIAEAVQYRRMFKQG